MVGEQVGKRKTVGQQHTGQRRQRYRRQQAAVHPGPGSAQFLFRCVQKIPHKQEAPSH